jgi:hypothetical protein
VAARASKQVRDRESDMKSLLKDTRGDVLQDTSYHKV